METGSGNNQIVVCENTMKVLKINLILPSRAEEESEKTGDHYFNNYAIMTIFFSYYPIGIVLHMIHNIKSK